MTSRPWSSAQRFADRTQVRGHRCWATFAGLALLLAALGLYGVISYSVRLRTRELGVRMALGAQRSRVLQLVLLQGRVWRHSEWSFGIVLAAVLGRLFSSLLFQVVCCTLFHGSSATGCADHHSGYLLCELSAGTAGGVHRADEGIEDRVRAPVAT